MKKGYFVFFLLFVSNCVYSEELSLINHGDVFMSDDKNSKTKYKLYKGEIVTILGKNKKKTQIKDTENNTGWIENKYLYDFSKAGFTREELEQVVKDYNVPINKKDGIKVVGFFINKNKFKPKTIIYYVLLDDYEGVSQTYIVNENEYNRVLLKIDLQGESIEKFYENSNYYIVVKKQFVVIYSKTNFNKKGLNEEVFCFQPADWQYDDSSYIEYNDADKTVKAFLREKPEQQFKVVNYKIIEKDGKFEAVKQ